MTLRAAYEWAIIDPAPVWAVVIPPLSFAIALRVYGATELHVREAGYLLTLLGIALVVFELRDTRRLFGKRAYGQRLVSWLKRFWRIWHNETIVASGAAAGLALAGTATATVRSVASDSSIAARLIAVEDNIRRVDDRVSNIERAVQREIDSLSARMTDEFGKRDELSAALSLRIEQFAAGSIDLALAGVIWAILGQTLGSFPGEIARYLNTVF